MRVLALPQRKQIVGPQPQSIRPLTTKHPTLPVFLYENVENDVEEPPGLDVAPGLTFYIVDRLRFRKKDVIWS